MNPHAEIPPGVDDQSAGFLERAYGLDDVADGQRLYLEWAKTYDTTMLDGLGYVSPRLVSEALAQYLGSVRLPILDVGCGTGLVGAEVVARSYSVIDGLDLSLAMMAVARQRGIYRKLIEADLRSVLPIDSDTYGGVVCAGTFTSGHVDAGCLDELARVLAPGGLLVCTVHHAVWEPLGFRAAFDRLIASGTLQPVAESEVGYYANTRRDGRLLVLRAGD
jgi:predicted TPR repeat methyltransferase